MIDWLISVPSATPFPYLPLEVGPLNTARGSGGALWLENTAGFFRLRQLRRVRRSLDPVSAATLVHAFVSSRVDYCNAIFAGVPKTTTDRLQRVLNAAARLVSDTRKFDRGLSRLMHTDYRASLAGRSWTYHIQARYAYVPMPAQPSSSVPDGPLYASLWSQLSPTSTFCQQPWGLRTTIPAQYLRTSGVFCCWPDCLELSAWRHVGSGMFCGQLRTVAEDGFIFAVLVCSAH